MMFTWKLSCSSQLLDRPNKNVLSLCLKKFGVEMSCGVKATSQLVNALKSEAESQSDSEQQKKLLAAAKLLADATARMVEAAKVKHILFLYINPLAGRGC